MKMNVLLNFFVIFVALSAVKAESIEELWKDFKLTNGRSYESKKTESERLENFKTNLKLVEENNQNELMMFKMGVNEFSDKSTEELKPKISDQFLETLWSSVKNIFIGKVIIARDYEYKNITKLPDEIDWRKLEAVTNVKNQGKCQSSHSLTSSSAIESHTFLHTGKLLNFSAQELIDCAEGNYGCEGGSARYDYNYIYWNGIGLDEDYHYTGVNGICRKNEGTRNKTKMFGFVSLKLYSEEALKEVVGSIGPVQITINSSPLSFHFYKEGIYNDPKCDSKSFDHSVLLVGYGTDEATGVDYWIIQNTWSENWGEKGYARILRNNSTCGIGTEAFWPLMKEADHDRLYSSEDSWKGVLIVVGIAVVLLGLFGACLWLCKFYCLRRNKEATTQKNREDHEENIKLQEI